MGLEQQNSWYRRIQPWLIWGLAASFFLADYFVRVSTGVMTTELMRAFNVAAWGLGMLSAFFYYPYMVMQLPVGLLVDRYSIRFLLTCMVILTGLGCAFFATAPTLGMAELGRFLIGFSSSFAFVSALKLASEWFEPRRLGLMAGLTQAAGMLGAAIGDAPVSLLVHAIGWRNAMWAMSSVFVLLAVLIVLIVRDHPSQARAVKTKVESSLSLWMSLRRILSNSQTWLNAGYAAFVYATTAAFGELWGVSYLEHVHGLSAIDASMGVSLIFIGWAVGGPLMGWCSDKVGLRRPFMYFSAICGGLLFVILLYAPHLSRWEINLILFCFGLTNTGVGIAYCMATEINPRSVVGASIAFLKIILPLGVDRLMQYQTKSVLPAVYLHMG